MELKYRKVVEGVELTKEEAKTLYDALKIIREAICYIDESCCVYDDKLVSTLVDTADYLEECNSKLSVSLIIGK